MAAQSTWQLNRSASSSRNGMVAAKTPQAAQVGVDILRKGGNAVDAAVATALAAGVVEPWMCGVGGGGFLIRHDSRSRATDVVAFPMVAPGGASAEMYTLTGQGTDSSFFGWPNVVGSENILGPRSVCVPGTVAGLDLALKSFGSIPFASALEPAIELAEEGVPVTWHTSMQIARDLGNLKQFPATAETFCPDGLVPWSITAETPAIIRQTDLAGTLCTLANEGARAFYEGSIGQSIVDYLRTECAPFAIADFHNYAARIEPALDIDYNGHTVSTTGYGSGGTTLAQSIGLLDRLSLARSDHNDSQALHLMAEAFALAFADRFAYLADPDFVEVPLEAMVSDEYLDTRAGSIDPEKARTPTPGNRTALGVSHSLAASIPDYTSGGSTTHLSVIDKDGVAVSLTLTLLNLWGSRATVPGTGILLNDGMMWFDPEPGKPNSIAGGKKPLSNMAPAILYDGSGSVAALGASGGRRIMNCVAQLTMNMADHQLPMQEAVSAPRLDRSTPQLFLSSRLPQNTVTELAAKGHDVVLKDESLFFGDFSSPACVSRIDGDYRGGVDPNYFPATAIGLE